MTKQEKQQAREAFLQALKSFVDKNPPNYQGVLQEDELDEDQMNEEALRFIETVNYNETYLHKNEQQEEVLYFFNRLGRMCAWFNFNTAEGFNNFHMVH